MVKVNSDREFRRNRREFDLDKFKEFEAEEPTAKRGHKERVPVTKGFNS